MEQKMFLMILQKTILNIGWV